MIWLKRLFLILILLLVVGGYFGYRFYNRQRFIDAGQKHALVTARAWVATATYRDDPVAYRAYRDSLLTAAGITGDQLREYLDRYKNEPEKYEYFARMVQYYVDSITAPLIEQVQDSADSLNAEGEL